MIYIKEFLNEFKHGQKLFAETIAVLINSFLLTLVYFIGIGLTSITAKIFKKQFLDMKISRKCNTYWEDLNLTKKPMEDYYRQF